MAFWPRQPGNHPGLYMIPPIGRSHPTWKPSPLLPSEPHKGPSGGNHIVAFHPFPFPTLHLRYGHGRSHVFLLQKICKKYFHFGTQLVMIYMLRRFLFSHAMVSRLQTSLSNTAFSAQQKEVPNSLARNGTKMFLTTPKRSASQKPAQADFGTRLVDGFPS